MLMTSREAAQRAQLSLVLLAPLSMGTAPGHSEDPDAVVGACVEHSSLVEQALSQLLLELGPQHALTRSAFQAKVAAARLSRLRPSWVTYCDSRARPEDSAAHRLMSREHPDPAAVRAWPHHAAARRAARELTVLLTDFHPCLAAVCGDDLTQGLGPSAM